MTLTTCPRLFEVEALRDGRLGGAERKSFERHLAVCTACAREAEALETLAGAARADAQNAGAADELHVLRQRTRLLAAFDRALVSPERKGSARRWLLLPAAAVVAVAGLVILRPARPTPSIPPAGAARADVHADGTTVWSRGVGIGNREEITLQRGLLWIHVDHSSGDRHLLVLLPDGELEDVGTTFTVSADGGHTTRVAVEEGRVSLRLRGQPIVDIGPTDVWLPGVPLAPTPALSAPPVPTPTSDSNRPPPPRVSRPPGVHPSPVAAPLDPLLEFRAAMGALRAGDNRRAAAGFTSFLDEHPRGPMAEDAAYLRVIALQRIGADGDMKRAAEDYLHRFPSGFRHAEVERLSH
jgi:anti-sigma factor RsiW